ncbi:MAG: lipid-A-disaccharide synthase [bacterium]|nr:lipid-A-disaccharide synthase [bacterium]
MKYFIIAGEKSGDLHGGSLIQQLRKLDNEAICKCFGGDEMKKAGGDILVHFKEMAFMGFLEVIRNLNKISRLLARCKSEIKNWNPDVVILIDYPGFNLKVARFSKSLDIKVHYYISPKIWAWNHKRVHTIKRYVDKVYSILPFEKRFYKEYGYEIEYVGNPLIERINAYQFDDTIVGKYKDQNCVAVLPGSRNQEVKSMGEVLSNLVVEYPGIRFLICAVSSLPDRLYNRFNNLENVDIIWDQPYDVLKVSRVAVVNSGTATLETALLEIPQIVCYRTSFLTYQIAKKLIRVKYISLVNLIADKPIVKELIQQDFNVSVLKFHLDELLKSEEFRSKMINEYSNIKTQLGNFQTSAIVAEKIFSSINAK